MGPGSSPLSRGIPCRYAGISACRGIIPALAGNTGGCGAGRAAFRDHPRSRGEYSLRVVSQRAPTGSSPLSRGIHVRVKTEVQMHRIIPALAGNTHGTEAFPHPQPDHPRSRGEYMKFASPVLLLLGSSPLSRGIRRFEGQDRVQRRIIPALAGNTSTSTVPMGLSPDHPRSRGEYVLILVDERTATGSSPLSRGIRVWSRPAPIAPRIIPALAGNTRVQFLRLASA